MKNFLIWLHWKLFGDIEEGTCLFIKEHLSFGVLREYESFLTKQGLQRKNYSTGFNVKAVWITHPITYKQMRRDFMWRFLVKGER